MKADRLEAIGSRGEACVIVRTESDDAGVKRYRYSLATGERLRPAAGADVFETFDAQRSFRLRDPSEGSPSETNGNVG